MFMDGSVGVVAAGPSQLSGLCVSPIFQFFSFLLLISFLSFPSVSVLFSVNFSPFVGIRMELVR